MNIILNIQASQKDGAIQLKFSKTESGFGHIDPLLFVMLGAYQDVIQTMNFKLNYSAEELVKLFGKAEPEYTYFAGNDDKSKNENAGKIPYKTTARTITLPAGKVMAALDMLRALQMYLAGWNFVRVSVTDKSIVDELQVIDGQMADDMISGMHPVLGKKNDPFFASEYPQIQGQPARQLPCLIQDYRASIPEQHVNNIVLQLAEQIANLPAPGGNDPHQSLKDDLHTLIAYAKANNLAFVDCLAPQVQAKVLYDFDFDTVLLNSEIPHQQKMRELMDWNNIFTAAGKLDEFARFLDVMHVSAMRKLYAPSLGKLAHDSGKYNENYTEMSFLRDAHFTLRNDGSLSINVEHNEAYYDHYAEGQKNHDKFEDEMRFLGKLIGLEFAENTDFHKEIIFTPACSQRLIADGVLFDAAFLKTLQMSMQIQHTFFAPRPQAPASDEEYDNEIVRRFV